MDSYGQFCPLAQAAEVVTRRWMLLVIRELLSGSRRFNDLHRGVPRMSRTLLSQRLTELEEAGVVERRVGDGGHPEYHLTEAGLALAPIVDGLSAWGKRWVRRRVSSTELDAGLLMWDVHRCIDRSLLPPGQVIVYFHFTDAPPNHQHFWLLARRDGVELCLHDPGPEEDLYVRSDVRTLTEIWLGDLGLTEALDGNALWIGGPPELRRVVKAWLGTGSAMAAIPRAPMLTP